MRTPARPAATLALAALLISCGPGGGTAQDDDTVTVFAAASLTDAFDEIATAYEAAAPGTSVELNVAGSSSLREQILEGAPADVFASADPANMVRLTEADAASDPRTFATNSLRIVVPAGNPGDVEGLDDLARDELLVGLCAPDVPCGAFGRRVLDGAGVTPSVDTEEPDVRALLTKVAAGELDVGLVYATDVIAGGDDVEGIDIPDRLNVTAEYPVAVVEQATDPDAARDFVDFLLGDGQPILERYGFDRP